MTHIHLDHAGGTGDIAEMFPAAEVVVHELGARHLADPSRLMASARMVYGDELDNLFGDPRADARRPDPRGRAHGRHRSRRRPQLEATTPPATPSIMSASIDSVSGDLYVGDAAGIYIHETGDMRPATPPPDFDLDVALGSLAHVRLAAAGAIALQPLRSGDRGR